MTLFSCGFFYFYNFEYQGSTNVSVKFIPIIFNGFGKEDVFAIFSNGCHLLDQTQIYNSETLVSDPTSSEI